MIETVASGLESGDVAVRGRATKLLGRLFWAKTSMFGDKTSNVARTFRPCFRKWLNKSIGEL